MKRDNPCYKCPKNGHGTGTGCGEHATCKKYLKYYDERREDYKQRERLAAANTYVRGAIERVKHGTRCTLKNYRPKEGK